MKELKPNNIIETIHFSLSTQECLDVSKGISETGYFTNGQLFDDTNLICLYNDTSLEIVDTENGRRKAAWNFRTDDTIKKISSVCLCSDYVIVSLICINDTGKLSLFDIGTSKVLKFIDLKYAPMSLSLIKEFGGAGTGHFLSPYLKFFFGIIAVGTMDGHILLIDLNLDVLQKSSSAHTSQLHLLDLATGCDVFKSRQFAIEENSHCAIDLSYNLCNSSSFKYVDQNGKLMRILSKGKSYISCLSFVKNVTSLFVGFNFGCFQIWSLENLQLVHSSEVGMLTSPVTHFVFQEPDDDPRHCCYVWVARGPEDGEADIIAHAASLSLYQLSYEIKTFKANFGNVYKEFECIMKRFHHRLTSDVHHLVDSRSTGSRVISFKGINCRERPITSSVVDDEETKRDSSDRTLCYVIWENLTNGAITCYLGLFDINRWYQKQLPGSIRDAMYGSMDAVCPFFAFYSLTDIVEHFLPFALLETKINEKTLNSFRTMNGPQNDQFYWPSSSAFLLSSFFESGKVTSEMLGVQRQIISEMRKISTDSFMDASKIVQTCWMNGLLQSTFDMTRASNSKKNADAVLSVNFENGGVTFIIDCIKKWVHGSITHSGHSLKLIFDWAWGQVVQRKKLLDQLHISLFSSTSNQLDTEQHNQLSVFAQDMKNLLIILNEINNSDVSTEQSGINEIKARLHIANHMATYARLLLVLVDMKLLPECSKISASTCEDNPVGYPLEVMSNFYETQRSERKLKKQCELLVDHLMTDTLELTGDPANERSSCKYPPASIQELCDIYFENPSEKKLHMLLVFYWVLDLKECFDNCSEKSVQIFQHLFDLSDGDLVFIRSIWLLDHFQKTECVDLITSGKNLFPAKYFTLIIKTLYKCEDFVLLTTLSSYTLLTKFNTWDWKFLLQIYINMKLLFNAYQLQSNISVDSVERKDIFNFFLEECRQEKLLGKVISLPFSTEEEEWIREYLESVPSLREFYLAYLLERGLIAEATDLAKKMELASQVRVDDMEQDQRALRQILVDGFIKPLPEICHKVMEMEEKRSIPEENLSPLSSMLRMHPERFMLQMCISDSKQDEGYSKGILGNMFVNPRRRKAPLFNADVKLSPTKKAKVMQTLPSTPKSKHEDLKFRKHFLSMSDAYSLLKSPKLAKQRTQSFAIEINTKTPQSILKSRKSTKKKGLAFSVPPKGANGNSTFNDDTPSRKIRFAGLSPTSPLSPALAKSPLAEIIKELQNADHSSSEQYNMTQILSDLSENQESHTENDMIDDDDDYENDASFDEVKIKKNMDFQMEMSPQKDDFKVASSSFIATEAPVNESRNNDELTSSVDDKEFKICNSSPKQENIPNEEQIATPPTECSPSQQEIVEIGDSSDEENESDVSHQSDEEKESLETSSEYYDEDEGSDDSDDDSHHEDDQSDGDNDGEEEISSSRKSESDEEVISDNDVIEINESSEVNESHEKIDGSLEEDSVASDGKESPLQSSEKVGISDEESDTSEIRRQGEVSEHNENISEGLSNKEICVLVPNELTRDEVKSSDNIAHEISVSCNELSPNKNDKDNIDDQEINNEKDLIYNTENDSSDIPDSSKSHNDSHSVVQKEEDNLLSGNLSTEKTYDCKSELEFYPEQIINDTATPVMNTTVSCIENSPVEIKCDANKKQDEVSLHINNTEVDIYDFAEDFHHDSENNEDQEMEDIDVYDILQPSDTNKIEVENDDPESPSRESVSSINLEEDELSPIIDEELTPVDTNVHTKMIVDEAKEQPENEMEIEETSTKENEMEQEILEDKTIPETAKKTDEMEAEEISIATSVVPNILQQKNDETDTVKISEPEEMQSEEKSNASPSANDSITIVEGEYSKYKPDGGILSHSIIEKNNLHFQSKVVVESFDISSQSHLLQTKSVEEVEKNVLDSENIENSNGNTGGEQHMPENKSEYSMNLRRSRRISKRAVSTKTQLKENMELVKKELNASNKTLITSYITDETNRNQSNEPLEDSNILKKTPEKSSRKSHRVKKPVWEKQQGEYNQQAEDIEESGEEVQRIDENEAFKDTPAKNTRRSSREFKTPPRCQQRSDAAHSTGEFNKVQENEKVKIKTPAKNTRRSSREHKTPPRYQQTVAGAAHSPGEVYKVLENEKVNTKTPAKNTRRSSREYKTPPRNQRKVDINKLPENVELTPTNNVDTETIEQRNNFKDSPSRNTRSKKQESLGNTLPAVNNISPKRISKDVAVEVQDVVMEPLVDHTNESKEDLVVDTLTKVSALTVTKTIEQTNKTETLQTIVAAVNSKLNSSGTTESKIIKTQRKGRRKTVGSSKDVSYDSVIPSDMVAEEESKSSESILSFPPLQENPKQKTSRSKSSRSSIAVSTLSSARRSTRLKEKRGEK